VLKQMRRRLPDRRKRRWNFSAGPAWGRAAHLGKTSMGDKKPTQKKAGGGKPGK
jgi:hypothetical protein